jgi:hypothetical protein
MHIGQFILRAINALIRKGYWYNNFLFPDCNRISENIKFGIDVLNLGSTSGVNAFCYEGININGVNLAMQGNPLLGDMEIMNNYSSYLKPCGSYVIMPLCPFSFLAGSYDYFDDRYYLLLNIKSIPNGNYKHRQNVYAKFQAPLLHYTFYGFFSDIKHLICSERAILKGGDYQANAEQWIKSWLHEFSMDSLDASLTLKDKDGIDDAIKILKSLITYCRYCNATPIIVIPPISAPLAKKLSVDTLNKFLYKPINAIATETGVRFIDYMYFPEMSEDLSLFKDAYLMNTKGAKLFTKKLLKDIGIRI